ncbi:uncharacterized protein C20orf85 homolog [Anthonomus grandis grandis]|uniref:uncharacterized protein C20orf85 homolog n=1 Tax=Anthonomus grandis grandis TaxID=2921223 RepID=UPI00216504CE|nr:uncharacterized protein C20orf85 homolog [Anthonomus grandis grandis]
MAASSACDLVVKYEVLRAQNLLEEKARRQWPQKWAVCLNFDKVLSETIREHGLTREEYDRRTRFKKPKGNLEPDIWPIKPSNRIPRTSSGVIGCRAYKEYSLEKFGPLYLSPKLTLPYDPPYHSIYLATTRV